LLVVEVAVMALVAAALPVVIGHLHRLLFRQALVTQ
jgi:hypothetical protein